MRLLPINYGKEVVAYCRELCHSLHYSDVDFVLDVLTVIIAKGKKCIPSDDALKDIAREQAPKLCAPYAVVISLMKSRQRMLREIVSQAVVGRLLERGVPPEEVLKSAMAIYATAYNALQVSQCKECQLFEHCGYGQDMGVKVKDVTKLIPPKETLQKIHPDCPYKQEIMDTQWLDKVLLMLQQIQEQMSAELKVSLKNLPGGGLFVHGLEADLEARQEATAQLDEEGEFNHIKELLRELGGDDQTNFGVANCGIGEGMGSAHTGQLITLDESFITKLAEADLCLFHLANDMEKALSLKTADKKVDSAIPTSQKRVRRMRSLTESSKVVPSQFALPSKVFAQKEAEKQLVVRQAQKHEEKPQLLHLLLDTTSSMTGEQATITTVAGKSVVTTASVTAAMLALAVLRRTRQAKGVVYFREFHWTAGSLFICQTDDEYKVVADLVSSASFNGQSTSIINAINTAVADIQTAKGTVIPKEILLITDGYDSLLASSREEQQKIRKSLNGILLNTLFLGKNRHVSPMKAISDTFIVPKKGAVSFDDFLELVKVIK